MKYFKQDGSAEHKQLQKLIRRKQGFADAKQLMVSIHSRLHRSHVYQSDINEVDVLFNDLNEAEYAMMPAKTDETIAWCVWHMARCEDLTMNLLVGRRDQVFNDEWLKRLHVSIHDTGNAMSDEEILQFSRDVSTDALLEYRDAVGMATKILVEKLGYEDMKRLVQPEDIKRIYLEGGVLDDPQSIWLLDYWQSKDVAGLILMPMTRHLMLHLNDISRMKQAIRK